MTWTYQQSTGELSRNSAIIAHGYSGFADGLNNPDEEWKINYGPIPRGQYHIGPAYYDQEKGPVVMALTPMAHNACGRSGFLCHGDNSALNHTASRGCIILDRDTRELIANSKDYELEVVR